MTRLRGVSHVRVFALPEHWEASLRFYGQTLQLPALSIGKDRRLAVFRLPDGVTLSLEIVDPGDSEHRPLVGRFLGVSLGVDDVQRVTRELRAAGVEFQGAPEKQPWGGTLAFFADPAGNGWTLVQASGSPRKGKRSHAAPTPAQRIDAPPRAKR